MFIRNRLHLSAHDSFFLLSVVELIALCLRMVAPADRDYSYHITAHTNAYVEAAGQEDMHALPYRQRAPPRTCSRARGAPATTTTSKLTPGIRPYARCHSGGEFACSRISYVPQDSFCRSNYGILVVVLKAFVHMCHMLTCMTDLDVAMKRLHHFPWHLAACLCCVHNLDSLARLHFSRQASQL